MGFEGKIHSYPGSQESMPKKELPTKPEAAMVEQKKEAFEDKNSTEKIPDVNPKVPEAGTSDAERFVKMVKRFERDTHESYLKNQYEVVDYLSDERNKLFRKLREAAKKKDMEAIEWISEQLDKNTDEIAYEQHAIEERKRLVENPSYTSPMSAEDQKKTEELRKKIEGLDVK